MRRSTTIPILATLAVILVSAVFVRPVAAAACNIPALWTACDGRPKSHGCVNLAPRVAEWIYYWSAEGPNDLWVWVHTSDKRDILNQFAPAAAVAGAN